MTTKLIAAVRSPLAAGGRVFVWNVGATFLLRIAGVGIQILSSAIAARALGVHGKGLLALAILLPQVLAIFLNLGVGSATTYFAGSGRLPVTSITSNATALAIILSLVGIVLTIFLLGFGALESLVPGLPTWAVLFALLVMPAALIRMFFSGFLQGVQRIIPTGLVETGRAAAILIGLVILVVWLHLDLAGALIAHALGWIVTGLVLARLVMNAGGALRPRLDRYVLRGIVPYGLRSHIGNLLSFFNYRLDIFLVNGFLGPAGVGIYSVSVALAELLWHLPNAVGTVIFPKAASTPARRMNEITPRVLGATLGVTAVGAVVLAFAGEHVIRWIYSDAFADAYLPLLILLPGVVLLGGGKVLTNEIAGRGYPHYNSINAALALALTIVLDLILIPRFGVAGAAMASTVAYSAVAVTSAAFYLVVKARSVERQTGLAIAELGRTV